MQKKRRRYLESVPETIHKKTYWIASLSDVNRDPRPSRLTSFLKENGKRVEDLIPYTPFRKESRIFGALIRKTLLGVYGVLFHLRIFPLWSCKRFLGLRYQVVEPNLESVNRGEVIFVFDLDALVFIAPILEKNKVILDLREIYTEQFGLTSPTFRFFLRPMRNYLLNHWAKDVAFFLTVSKGLQDYYAMNFGITSEILRSVPRFAIEKSELTVKNPIRTVYVGVANPLRQIETMIKAIIQVEEEIELHLYLVGDEYYIESLKEEYGYSSRIIFHAPIEFHNIPCVLVNYDLGWSYFYPTTENLRRALPNKFFDYIQAGLAVIHGPNLDMMAESEKWGFGFCSEQYTLESLIALLSSLDQETVIRAKRKAREASQELSFERESIVLERMIGTLGL